MCSILLSIMLKQKKKNAKNSIIIVDKAYKFRMKCLLLKKNPSAFYWMTRFHIFLVTIAVWLMKVRHVLLLVYFKDISFYWRKIWVSTFSSSQVKYSKDKISTEIP